MINDQVTSLPQLVTFILLLHVFICFFLLIRHFFSLDKISGNMGLALTREGGIMVFLPGREIHNFFDVLISPITIMVKPLTMTNNTKLTCAYKLLMKVKSKVFNIKVRMGCQVLLSSQWSFIAKIS